MKNEKLVDLLIEKNYKISCAESCTGGMLASTIIDVPNASKVMDMAFITYANESKISLVNVKRETIEQYGVVSEEVAKEMAIGVADKADCQVGVGITGLAGPNGGTKEKPIGTVCFGIKVLDKIYSYTHYFGNIGRFNIRKKSVDFVLDKILNALNNNDI